MRRAATWASVADRTIFTTPLSVIRSPRKEVFVDTFALSAFASGFLAVGLFSFAARRFAQLNRPGPLKASVAGAVGAAVLLVVVGLTFIV